MNRQFIYLVIAVYWCAAGAQLVTSPATTTTEESEEPPEGYYAFVESPNATPPRVRPPPYRQSAAECGGGAGAGVSRPHVSAHNLCGDLNRGLIPRNPLGQLPAGQPYPFELIRNETLRFLSRTLPVLRADDALPRVAHVGGVPEPPHAAHYPADLPEMAGNRLEERVRRSAEEEPVEHRADDAPRESRKFCDGGGV